MDQSLNNDEIFSETFQSELHKIKSDVLHGASHLTIKLFDAIIKEGEENKKLAENFNSIAEELKKLQPEMRTFQNSIEIIEEKISKKKLNQYDFLEIIKAEKKIFKEKEEQTINNLENHLEKYKIIMTLSYSTTIVKALTKSVKKIGKKKIFVLESRPKLEGRLTAKKVSIFGHDVKVILDAAAAEFAKKVDVIIIGADTIYSDEAVLNKIGSAQLALLALHYNIPFLVAASTNKNTKKSSDEIRDSYLRFRNPKEIGNELYPNIELLNIYFELIPKEIIKKMQTKGILFRVSEV